MSYQQYNFHNNSSPSKKDPEPPVIKTPKGVYCDGGSLTSCDAPYTTVYDVIRYPESWHPKRNLPLAPKETKRQIVNIRKKIQKKIFENFRNPKISKSKNLAYLFGKFLSFLLLSLMLPVHFICIQLPKIVYRKLILPIVNYINNKIVAIFQNCSAFAMKSKNFINQKRSNISILSKRCFAFLSRLKNFPIRIGAKCFELVKSSCKFILKMTSNVIYEVRNKLKRLFGIGKIFDLIIYFIKNKKNKITDTLKQLKHFFQRLRHFNLSKTNFFDLFNLKKIKFDKLSLIKFSLNNISNPLANFKLPKIISLEHLTKKVSNYNKKIKCTIKNLKNPFSKIFQFLNKSELKIKLFKYFIFFGKNCLKYGRNTKLYCRKIIEFFRLSKRTKPIKKVERTKWAFLLNLSQQIDHITYRQSSGSWISFFATPFLNLFILVFKNILLLLRKIIISIFKLFYKLYVFIKNLKYYNRLGLVRIEKSVIYLRKKSALPLREARKYYIRKLRIFRKRVRRLAFRISLSVAWIGALFQYSSELVKERSYTLARKFI